MHEVDKTKLSDQTKFRLYEIKKNTVYSKKEYSKKLNRYVTIFDDIDKILIILSATASGVSIISFTSTIGKSVGIVSATLTLIFSLTTGIIKKLLNITMNKRKKHDQLIMLAESKFNSIEKLISQALGDLDIRHEEFVTILKEKDRYERMKYNLISENGDEKQENVKLIKKKQHIIKK